MKPDVLQACSAGITRGLFPIALLAALSADLIFGEPAQAQAPVSAGAAAVVEGMAATTDGQRLAHATIYLTDIDPPPLGSRITSSQLTVVTDGNGHFVWNVPEGYNLRPGGNEPAPKCWMLAADRSVWSVSIQPAAPWDDASAAGSILRSTTRECVTRWLRKGANPLLSVIAPETAVVRIPVRDPNGHALRGHAVELFSVGDGESGFGSVVYEGKTSSGGELEVRCFAGVSRLQIFAPCLGFVSTGVLELLPGKEIDARLPPMSPFARLSGSVTLPKSGDSLNVALGDYEFQEHRWYRPAAVVDSAGLWEIADVLPGQHRIVAIAGKTVVTERQVTVQAGEILTGIRLAPSNAGHSASTGYGFDSAPTSVHGTVTDCDGRPAASTIVYAVWPANNLDGWGSQKVLKTTTDDKGHYSFSDLLPAPYALSTRIVACREESGIAEASPLPESGDAPREMRADLILPPAKTGLRVRVLQGGQPISSVSVRLTPVGDSVIEFHSPFGFPPQGLLGEVARLLKPTAVTDAEGWATFIGVFPGLWDVAATESADVDANEPDPALRIFLQSMAKSLTEKRAPAKSPAAIGTARNVAIRAGNLGEFVLSIASQPIRQVAFQVLGPDGSAPSEAIANVEDGPAVPAFGGSRPVTLDAQGNGTIPIRSAGLWQVAARFRDNDMKTFSPRSEPYCMGQTVYAVSAAAPTPERVIVHTARRGPGALRVRVEDADGKPVRAAVTVGDVGDTAAFAASTDAHGEAFFGAMSSGRYTIAGSLSSTPHAPLLGQEGDPFPSDSELARAIQVMPQTVDIWPDHDATVTLHAERMGYIQGWLHVSGQVGDYTLGRRDYSASPVQFRVDPVTGEFVAGPFPAGKTTLALSRNAIEYGRIAPLWVADINVVADSVSHVTLISGGVNVSPEVSAATETICTLRKVMPRYAMRSQLPLSGTVLLADGVTPAWGARVVVVMPDANTAVVVKRTDLAGQPTSDITPAWEPYRFRSPKSLAEKDPADSVLVAWLPGATGAVVLPYDSTKPFRAVLPPSVELRGRVTLGLKPIIGDASSFRVVAAYQGYGRLDRYLSVEATAQADGSFTLSGLTPGVYRVQAVRDGIWLSEAQTLAVDKSSTKLPDLTLDIPTPGQVMDLHLVDAAGKPLPGAVVSITRPEGPLTDEIWPTLFTADGAGDLHLEGLNAGPETLTIYSAPEAGTSDYGKPARSALTKIVTDVPLFAAGSPAIVKSLVCAATPPQVVSSISPKAVSRNH